MPSLSNIPEPTTAYRPDNTPAAPKVAVQTLDTPQRPEIARPQHELQADSAEEPQQQIDSVSCLLLLLIAGGLLRLVLGFFGPLQGTDPERFSQLAEQGQRSFSSDPANAFPVPDLLATALASIGASGWLMVAIGSLLTLAAAPAAYVIGRATTGRRAAGILAAALLTVHPAVLTFSNTLSGTALAMSLVTIGLALALHSAKRGYGFALGGGITLALAGLAAPLCWIVAALAAPLVGQLNQRHGAGRAISYALTVFVLALGPIVGYRLACIGTSTDALLVEFRDQDFVGSDIAPTDRMLITLTDPSLAELGNALGLPVGDAGRLAANTIGVDKARSATNDVVADVLADSWLLMNAALASLAAVSIGVMLARRRWVETCVLAVPIMAMAFANVTPGETLRMPMLALVGVLAAGLLTNRPVVVVDEAKLAERAARKAAKTAAKEEKARAKQQREAEKQKQELFAFDKPSRRERKARARQLKQATERPQLPAGILTERVEDAPSIPARPI